MKLNLYLVLIIVLPCLRCKLSMRQITCFMIIRYLIAYSCTYVYHIAVIHQIRDIVDDTQDSVFFKLKKQLSPNEDSPVVEVT